MHVRDLPVLYSVLPALGNEARGGMTERVRAVLREAIVNGDIAPGATIDKASLCERLGVSRFPVSEALSRLAAEGLVEVLPQRATRVARIRIADVEQNMFIRRALEAETVRVVAPCVTGDVLAALERNLRYQQAAVAADDRRGFYMLDVEFHDILLNALDFARVKALVETARASLERVRRLLSSPRRHALTYAEHVAILDALARRQGAVAAAAMEAHLDAVLAELSEFARAHPEIFEDAPAA
jgi:DNA-binding GntR family transcriptional regulator